VTTAVEIVRFMCSPREIFSPVMDDVKKCQTTFELGLGLPLRIWAPFIRRLYFSPGVGRRRLGRK